MLNPNVHVQALIRIGYTPLARTPNSRYPAREHIATASQGIVAFDVMRAEAA